MRLEEYIKQLADRWALANGRTLSALGGLVAKDGKFFSRIEAGGRITTAKFEDCLSFFRDPANWPDNSIPETAAHLLEQLDNISTGEVPSSGKAQQTSRLRQGSAGRVLIDGAAV